MQRVYGAYGVLGLVLWPIPLLNVLQVESAAVVAFTAFFVAGGAATRRFEAGEDSFVAVLGRQEAALVVPLVMLTVSQLWAPNCTFGQGLLFYTLFPCVTVVFAVALAYLVTGAGFSRPVWGVVIVGIGVSLLGPVYDLGGHPQFYTYNHVFGGVLGPIYDEQLAVRGGLFAFRALTLVWVGAAWFAGRLLRGRSGWMGLVGCVVAIVGLYGFAVPLGINTSVGHLQDQLGGHVQTEHFDIYYAPKRLDRRAVEALAADHEAAYRFLQRRLDLGDVDGPERIQSYLYPNPDVKARLTGARYTSVSPVWLQEPQVHLLVDRVEASLGHELAHVFSRPYGLPLLNASWLPGLVEGWAVALEPPDPYPSVHDLVRVATATEETQALSGKAGALVDRLTPWGFWTGRGAVSYATMGSFVRYLLDRYGPDRLKAVYATGSFESVYDRSLAGLAEEWADSLAARPMVARAAQDVVAQRFTQPSLFESECPHFVPIHQRHLQAARTARRRGDTSVVSRHLRRSLEVEPRYIPAHEVLARRRLAQGRISTVRRQLDTIAAERRTAEILLLQGDARARGGQPDSARRYYENARHQLPLYAHEARARLLLRRAVADRPDVVRVLTSGDPAREQARSLTASLTETTNVVQAWQALRFLDAHRYAAADSVWQEGASFRPDGPRAWRRAYGIQSRAWRAEAAYRAGRFSAAQRLAETASATAAAHGARAWSRMLQRWAQRARRSPL